MFGGISCILLKSIRLERIICHLARQKPIVRDVDLLEVLQVLLKGFENFCGDIGDTVPI